MKKTWKQKAAALTFALLLTAEAAAAPEAIYASGQSMSYSSESGMITGELTTTGENNIARVEIYYTNTYDYKSKSLYMTDTTSGNRAYLYADEITTNGDLSGNAEVRYGGTIAISEYNVTCLIYYVITESPMTWTVNIKYDDTLGECIIAQSVVPSDWQDTASAIITQPTSIDLYFINEKNSTITSYDQVTAIVEAQMQTADTVSDAPEGEVIEEEQGDPITAILTVLIIVMAIAIVATGVVIRKEKKKKASDKSREFVKKQNEKTKKKKIRENEDLTRYMDDFDAEYQDEGTEEGEEYEARESLGAPAVAPVAEVPAQSQNLADSGSADRQGEEVSQPVSESRPQQAPTPTRAQCGYEPATRAQEVIQMPEAPSAPPRRKPKFAQSEDGARKTPSQGAHKIPAFAKKENA